MANTTGKKHGGREKETPNVLTKEEREVLKVVVFEEVALIQNHLIWKTAVTIIERTDLLKINWWFLYLKKR